MAMTLIDSPTIRSTNWCWGATPIEGGRLASQPTISRVERTAAPRMLRAMSDALADRVLARHRRRRRGARLITIDLDVTEDETHGAQQLTFFNGFYDPWGYLPLVASRTFDDEARQHLVAAILRPGNAAGTAGAVGLLPKRWRAFPRARLRVRLEGGFATPEIFDPLEAAGVEYVVAMGNTAVLTRHAEPAGAPLRAVVATTPRARDCLCGGGVSGGHLGGAPAHHDQSRSGVAPRTSAAR